MDTNTQAHQSEILTPKEIRRYNLQIGLPGLGMKGQEKLKNSSVLVIGAGGKGSSVLENLVTVGTGRIGISDNFPVQEQDLSRQHLYGNGDLGKQKAIIARQKLQEINHLVDLQLHNVCLNKDNIGPIAARYDVLVDATDNFPAHYLIDETSKNLKKPLIFGSFFNSQGYVSVFNYGHGGSLKDTYPQPEKETGYTGNGFACQVTLMSIIGAIMANETIKVLLGMDSVLAGNILVIDSASYTLNLTKPGKVL